MNNHERLLNRLIQAARPGPLMEEAGEMPAYLKTRVLAHWRALPPADELGRGLALVFRNAFMCAALIMLVSIAWSFDTQEPDSETDLPNYELQEDLML
jgi:hypothetical protein